MPCNLNDITIPNLQNCTNSDFYVEINDNWTAAILCSWTLEVISLQFFYQLRNIYLIWREAHWSSTTSAIQLIIAEKRSSQLWTFATGKHYFQGIKQKLNVIFSPIFSVGENVSYSGIKDWRRRGLGGERRNMLTGWGSLKWLLAGCGVMSPE